MSRGDTGVRTRPDRRADLALSALTAALVCAGMWSLVGPLKLGAWVFSAFIMIGSLSALGYILRRLRAYTAVIVLVQIMVIVGYFSATVAPGSTGMGFIPTHDTVRLTRVLFAQVYDEMLTGIAPMEISPALALVLTVAAGTLAIVLDVTVVRLRWPIAGAVVILLIGLIPPLIVPAAVNLNALVLVMILALLVTRRATYLHERVRDAGAQHAGPALSAALIAATALVAGVGVAPLIDGPRTQVIPGFGPALSIVPTLNLGNDLRQPRDTDVLRVSSDMPAPPYLRISTLSEFDGSTWVPSREDSVSIESFAEDPPVDVVDPAMRVTEYTTTLDTGNLTLDWLPLPYPATTISGITGAWGGHESSRTATAERGTSAGSQQYSVASRVVRPSAEQIRAAATGGQRYPHLTELPQSTPASLQQLAREVTANTTNNYDRLVALQTWFRSSEFRYSLDAPVEEGFDGNSMDAIERFLDVKAGYCAHYAAAFTLMARSLDMPARIVVGFLPGEATGDTLDGNTVYRVTSGRLHAWPEVFFEGIGWVPFEPTQSLGTPTSFAATQPADVGGTEVGSTQVPTTAPESELHIDPDDPTTAPRADTDGDDATAAAFSWLPLVPLAIGVIAVLMVPAFARIVVRRGRRSLILQGSAPIAWREIIATAADLGLASPPSASPREIGAQLIGCGAPQGDMSRLVTAVERASYSAETRWQSHDGTALYDAVVRVRRGLHAGAHRHTRALGFVAPRSLLALPLADLAARGEKHGSPPPS